MAGGLNGVGSDIEARTASAMASNRTSAQQAGASFGSCDSDRDGAGTPAANDACAGLAPARRPLLRHANARPLCAGHFAEQRGHQRAPDPGIVLPLAGQKELALPPQSRSEPKAQGDSPHPVAQRNNSVL